MNWFYVCVSGEWMRKADAWVLCEKFGEIDEESG